jgi:hypothetical protein
MASKIDNPALDADAAAHELQHEALSEDELGAVVGGRHSEHGRRWRSPTSSSAEPSDDEPTYTIAIDPPMPGPGPGISFAAPPSQVVSFAEYGEALEIESQG